MIGRNPSHLLRTPAVTAMSRAILSVSSKQVGATPLNILPGVFHEELPDLLLSREQCGAIKTIQALTYLKSLSFIHRYLVFPSWKSNNYKQKRERRLGRYIKSVERVLGRHKYAANEEDFRSIVGNKGDWVRYTTTVLFDLSMIQQYRQHIYHNNATSPIAIKAIQEIYDKRLAILDLNAQVWCEEGSQLGCRAKNIAKRDLVDALLALDDLLQTQAKHDVVNLISCSNRSLGRVKQLALETYFYQSYKKRLITEGLSIPRFKWQLRSTLSASIYKEVKAALA